MQWPAVFLVTISVNFGAVPMAPYSPDRVARLESLVFAMPLATFRSVATRPTGGDVTFDWSSDECSAPLIGNTGRSFDFTWSCRRHDFAYRNFKRADAASSPRGQWWNSSIRRRIDTRFRQDMASHCELRQVTERVTCRMWAEIFYRLVRVAGGP